MATKVLDCDLVVIGGGGSGLVAAVKASDDSGKKVIVLEKARKTGGASYFAGGPGVGKQGGPGGGSRSKSGDQGGQGGPGGGQSGQQAGQGGPSGQQGGSSGGPSGGQGGPQGSGGAQSLMMGFNSWFTQKVGAENFVTANRMEKFKDLPDPSIGPGRGGTFTVEKMVEFSKKQGIQILTETPAKKLFTDGAGKITGVLAQSKDGEIQINCKAVIVACGGFGRNYEMLKKWWPEEYNYKEIFFLCPPGITGDGITMAEAAGAYIDQTKWSQSAAGGFFSSGPMHHPYSWAVQNMMSDSRFIAVNLEGKRWSEGGMGGGGRSSLGSQPGGGIYKIADSAIVEAVGTGLVTNGQVGPGGNKADADSNEAKAIKKWKEDLEYECACDEEGASGRHACKANTLIELALKMGVDPAIFVASIEEYNKEVDSGKVQSGGMMGMPSGMGGQQGGQDGQDPGGGQTSMKGGPGGSQPSGPGGNQQSGQQGGSGGGMMGGMGGGAKAVAIRKAPFYAIWGHRFSQCTKGLNGIAVNNDFQVLNPKGETMDNLWAAGDTCTIYGGLVLQGGMGPGANNQTASTKASDGNILHTTPSPCGGAMAAFMSGYTAGEKAATFLKKG
jgi:hypothetical protein